MVFFFVWFPFYKSADFVPYSSHLRFLWLACPLSERRARGDTLLNLQRWDNSQSIYADAEVSSRTVPVSRWYSFSEPMTCRTAVKIDEVASNGWIAFEYLQHWRNVHLISGWERKPSKVGTRANRSVLPPVNSDLHRMYTMEKITGFYTDSGLLWSRVIPNVLYVDCIFFEECIYHMTDVATPFLESSCLSYQ